MAGYQGQGSVGCLVHAACCELRVFACSWDAFKARHRLSTSQDHGNGEATRHGHGHGIPPDGHGDSETGPQKSK